MDEVWKQIPGYGEHYEASSFGRIRVKDRFIMRLHPVSRTPMNCLYKSKLLKQSKCKWGYLHVSLGVGGKGYSCRAHHLVLLAFVGPRPDGAECCHNNSITYDNRPENLRWDSHYNNNQDRKLRGMYASHDKHPMAKLTPTIIEDIRTSPETGKNLAKKYGVWPSQISRIRRNTSWIQ